MQAQIKILIVLSLMMGLGAHAEVIDNHMNSELRLGYGIDPVTETVYDECVTFTPDAFKPEDQFKEYKSLADVPSRNLKLNVEMVTSYEQVDKYTNTSISAGVKYAAYSGSFNYNKETRFSLESDRAMVGVEASADYGRWYVQNVQLKPKYRKLFEEDPEKFYAVCGREYVSGFMAGQGMRILLATEKLSVYSYQKISTSVSAAANAGAFSASVGGSFLSVAEELSKLGSLTVNLFTYGGKDFSNISPLIESDSDLEKFRKNVAALAKEMKVNQAVRTAWITQPYPVDTSPDDRLLYEQQRRTLRDLFQIYRRLGGARDRLLLAVTGGLDHHLRPYCSQGMSEECQSYILQMNQRLDEIDNAIGVVQDFYKTCWNTNNISECRLPPVEVINVDYLTQIKWPKRFQYELYQTYLDKIKKD